MPGLDTETVVERVQQIHIPKGGQPTVQGPDGSDVPPMTVFRNTAVRDNKLYLYQVVFVLDADIQPRSNTAYHLLVLNAHDQHWGEDTPFSAEAQNLGYVVTTSTFTPDVAPPYNVPTNGVIPLSIAGLAEIEYDDGLEIHCPIADELKRVPLLPGDRFIFNTQHIGVPAHPFPGGLLILTFTASPEAE